jgi:hypothetical protein
MNSIVSYGWVENNCVFYFARDSAIFFFNSATKSIFPELDT